MSSWSAAAMAPFNHCFALSTAVSSESPCARLAAIADDKEHPVPWVFRVSIRGERSQVLPDCVTSRSELSLSYPMSALDQGPILRPTSKVFQPVTAFHSSLSAIESPVSLAASCKLGVTRSANGINVDFTASTACSANNRSPDVATITGSSTMLAA